MGARRFRLKFMFWLDMNKSDEYDLAERIEELKEQRLFSQTIRDGIRLICDLRAGRVDTLLELFPWVASELSFNANEAELYQEIENLRDLILQQQAQMPRTVEPPSVVFDEDEEDFELEVRAVSGGNSAQNFLSSVLSLQH